MPCDYSKYPADWKQIRARILERDVHRCKWCGVPNYGFRSRTTDQVLSASDYAIQSGHPLWNHDDWIKIVLTVAHTLNPDPMDCRDENLAALCQRCHLRHDAKQHAENARATRDAKKGQGTLMEVQL